MIFANALPSNFTDKVQMEISIEGKFKGELLIGLYGKESPKAVTNFLIQCDNERINVNLTNL